MSPPIPKRTEDLQWILGDQLLPVPTPPDICGGNLIVLHLGVGKYFCGKTENYVLNLFYFAMYTDTRNLIWYSPCSITNRTTRQNRTTIQGEIVPL